MSRTSAGLRAGGVVLALSAAGPGFAQTGDPAVTGRVSLGVRGVDVDGATTKYREDVNLDDGVRLFGAALNYAPGADTDAPVDRIDLDVSSLGGDPFETAELRVRKHGAYELDVKRRRSEYFYEDVILPPRLASIDAVTGGDFHTFDFERVHDEAKLDIHVSPATEVKLGLERYTRSGDSTTTRDIQRDEFELDKPIDESLEAMSMGVQHRWNRVTLIYELQRRDFENASELFLPGASPGADPENASELQLFSLEQSYDYRSLGHVMRVVARPSAELDLQAAWRVEDLDLDMDAAERAAGTDFAGAPFSTEAAGTSAVGRDIALGELGVGYGIGDRLRVRGAVRRLNLEQRGTLLFAGEPGSGVWDIATTGFEAGLEIAATSRVIVSAGLSRESREAVHASRLAETVLGRRETTDRDGYFARLTFDGAGGLDITASVEDDDIDDPYALASPDASRRYRVRARHRWDNGVSLSASLRRDDVENAVSGWAGATTQSDLRVAYNTDGLQLSLGLARIDLGRRVEQLVSGGSRQDTFAIDYDADARFVDADARWLLGERLAIGGGFRFYDNDGSFPLERDDVRGFLELELTDDYALEFRYRELDYAEDRFDDYDAKLLEAELAMRW